MTIFRTCLATAAAVAGIAGAAVPAHASADVTAVTLDGRTLAVGSVVSEGTRSGDLCTFADDSVIVMADYATDSSISLAVDDGCRLVVRALGTSIPTSSSVGVRYTAPKVYETTGSSSGSGVGTISGIGSVGGLVGTEDPVAMILDAAATAAATTKVDVQAVQIIYNEAGVQEYRDYVAVQYVRNTRTHTVGTMEPYNGSCEGSYIDENVLYGPYANDILSCFYKETANGPSKVGFVSGGTYRKGIATITVDQRKLTETFEATYSGPTKRVCSTGGTLRTGWSSTCYFDIN